MKYLELTFATHPNTETVNDVLAAVLGDIGFESFMGNDAGITAYIPAELFDEQTLKHALETFPMADTSLTYTLREADDKDWNEEWEKNCFQPIVIGNRCVVHSTFHKDVPVAEYDIVINPQMAFGTGHHETTGLIMGELLDADLQDKSFLDMGCGTSILSILARMRGAKPVTAIDIDTWCIENSMENIALNKLSDIKVELGDAAILKGRAPFDVIVANINRNILLADMSAYVDCMKPNATLYISGFYTEDIPLLREKAESLGLVFSHSREQNNWAVVAFHA
jgi:ribosomal protein L11 methyltransferase